MRPFLLYAVIRLGLWVLIWWLLTLMGVGLMLAGVLAALLAMLISILFLDRLRDAAAMRWKAADERRAERRGQEIDEDAEFEDSLLDDSGEGDDPLDPEDPDGTGDLEGPRDPEGSGDLEGWGEIVDPEDPEETAEPEDPKGPAGTDGIRSADR